MSERETQNIDIKKIKPGSFVLIDEIVCKVDKVSSSKPGKHGAAKVKVEGRGVFESAKKMLVKPSGSNAKTPIILKKTMQVVAIMGDNAQIMDLETYETNDLPVPDELKGTIDSGDEVLVWVFGSQMMIVSKK